MIRSMLQRRKRPRLSNVNADLVGQAAAAKQAETCICELTMQRTTDGTAGAATGKHTMEYNELRGDVTKQCGDTMKKSGDVMLGASPHATPERCARFCKRRSNEQLSQDLTGSYVTYTSVAGFDKENRI